MAEINGEDWKRMTPEEQIEFLAQEGSWPQVQYMIKDTNLNLDAQEMGELLATAYEVAIDRMSEQTPASFRNTWQQRATQARAADSKENLLNLVLQWFT